MSVYRVIGMKNDGTGRKTFDLGRAAEMLLRRQLRWTLHQLKMCCLHFLQWFTCMFPKVYGFTKISSKFWSYFNYNNNCSWLAFQVYIYGRFIRFTRKDWQFLLIILTNVCILPIPNSYSNIWAISFARSLSVSFRFFKTWYSLCIIRSLD